MKTVLGAFIETICPKYAECPFSQDEYLDCFKKGGRCDIFEKAIFCPVCGKRLGWSEKLEYFFVD